MLMLTLIRRNDRIVNLLHNVVWISLFLRHPNSWTKPLPRQTVSRRRNRAPLSTEPSTGPMLA